MTIFLAILAALVAVSVIVFMLRIAPRRTEAVSKGSKPSGGQGEELSRNDRAA